MSQIPSAQPDRKLFVILFAISGFTGLIYESIWTHYLKLFLGHAAYAQSLVLTIFMGGMALGAWSVSRGTARWKNLVRIYAVTEGCIGLAACIFHSIFSLFLDASFSSIIPALGSPLMVDGYKWTTAALLIAPQSILLGMTFPLMAGGVVRRFPDETGRNLALLYFSNSTGAAVGALVSGFWLIEWLGLPGTMRSAGVINLVLAIMVWQLASIPEPEKMHSNQNDRSATAQGMKLFLAGAFITGTASFIYEIAWIRMLSLVLGTTFHAFELMLSAFITGIALGGLWIRGRIDRIQNPVQFLGHIQIIMGLLALATLMLYNHSFTWMSWLMNNLETTDSGYALFNLGSHAVAFAIMLPATFCAGMTLPLFTHILIRRGHGEKSIGRVYASNTLGSIVGVLFAIHVGMPALGLKLLMIVGALLDVVLGMLLLRFSQTVTDRMRGMTVPTVALIAIALVVRFIDLDPRRMAAGVYRTGLVELGDREMLFHRDGKTATISVYSHQGITATIATNGKPDAKITIDGHAGASPDEITMVMAAALPLAIKPDAKKIANIGFGSGLTTHTFLAYPYVERVDSIEIEAGVIEGSKIFLPRVRNAYRDPRSQIHIEDAKTWFAKHNKQFDIIVSEPSNPWVSGVGSLFSDEFYQNIRRYLADDGILVQWLQLYEFNDRLVASVLGALDKSFDDYAIFNTDNSNILIVARKRGVVPGLSDKLFEHPSMQRELTPVGILSPADLELRLIATKRILSPLYAKLGAPSNSDYYPILGMKAPRARFKREWATAPTMVGIAPLPILELIEGRPEWWQKLPIANTDYLRAQKVRRANRLHQAMLGTRDIVADIEKEDAALVQQILSGNKRCKQINDTGFDSDLHELAISTLPFASPQQLVDLWHNPDWARCDGQRSQLKLYQAIARRNPASMLSIASKQLAGTTNETPLQWRRYLLASALLGARALNQPEQILQLFNQYLRKLYPDGRVEVYVLAIAHY